MPPLQAVALLFVGLGALLVVLARDLVRQALLFSLYGFALVVLFLVFQAPDVALSQMAVGAVALPLMIVLALAKVKRQEKK